MLIKLFAVRRSEYNLVVFSFGFQCRYSPVYRLALHDHSGESTIWIVVHTFPFVRGIVAQIVQVYFRQPFFCARAKMDSLTNPSSISGKTVIISIRIFAKLFIFLSISQFLFFIFVFFIINSRWDMSQV